MTTRPTPPHASPDIALIVEWTLDAHETWEDTRLYGAVAAARTAQWSEEKIARFLVGMAFDPAATPWDLTNAAREPQDTAACVPAPPKVREQAMAQMRAASRAALQRGRNAQARSDAA